MQGGYEIVDQLVLLTLQHIKFDIWYSGEPGTPESAQNFTTMMKFKFDYLKLSMKDCPC